MIINVNFSMFCDGFLRMDRKDSFSYEGKKALFDYLERLEEDTGEQIELDVIAICSEYTEYSTADEAAKNYFEYEGMIFDEDGNETMTADEVQEKALEFLQNRTIVLSLGFMFRMYI